MPTLFRLSCACGHHLPVDVSQAGQQIVCPQCGGNVQVPTLLHLRRLAPFETDKHAQVAARSASSGTLRFAFFLLGGIMLVVSGVLLLCCFVPVSVPLLSSLSYPASSQVLEKRIWLSYGGRELPQDSSPLSSSERQVLRITDYELEHLRPIQLYDYFRMMAENPNFSNNFYENYRALLDAYYIRVTTFSMMLIVSLGFVVAGFFLPKHNQEILGWSGGEW